MQQVQHNVEIKPIHAHKLEGIAKTFLDALTAQCQKEYGEEQACFAFNTADDRVTVAPGVESLPEFALNYLTDVPRKAVAHSFPELTDKQVDSLAAQQFLHMAIGYAQTLAGDERTLALSEVGRGSQYLDTESQGAMSELAKLAANMLGMDKTIVICVRDKSGAWQFAGKPAGEGGTLSFKDCYEAMKALTTELGKRFKDYVTNPPRVH